MRLATLLLPFLALPIVSQGGAQVRGQTADDLLRSMTLEQKAGQLFMLWILSSGSDEDAPRQQMRQWIREVGLGGVVLSLGSAEIQYQSGVNGKSLRISQACEFLDQSGLADAGFATHDDGLAIAGFQTMVERGGKLPQLPRPTNKRMGAFRPAVAESVEPP